MLILKCENHAFVKISEMDKYVPLHALHLSISWPAHLHMYLCRFLRGLSHTAGVSECHGFSVWICVFVFGSVGYVCVNVLGYVGLFSQSICFLDLSVDVSFYTSSISWCVCIYVPYCFQQRVPIRPDLHHVSHHSDWTQISLSPARQEQQTADTVNKHILTFPCNKHFTFKK